MLNWNDESPWDAMANVELADETGYTGYDLYLVNNFALQDESSNRSHTQMDEELTELVKQASYAALIGVIAAILVCVIVVVIYT